MPVIGLTKSELEELLNEIVAILEDDSLTAEEQIDEIASVVFSGDDDEGVEEED